jgi:MraZ protein
MYSVRVDEKGRLKLSADIVKYLQALGDSEVFITTIDGRIARLYPISIWRHNEKLQSLPSDDQGALEDVVWLANRYGAKTEMDAQGRVVMHTELRRMLGFENEQVYLSAFNGCIEIQSKAAVDEREAQARLNIAAKMASAKQRGFR